MSKPRTISAYYAKLMWPTFGAWWNKNTRDELLLLRVRCISLFTYFTHSPKGLAEVTEVHTHISSEFCKTHFKSSEFSHVKSGFSFYWEFSHILIIPVTLSLAKDPTPYSVQRFWYSGILQSQSLSNGRYSNNTRILETAIFRNIRNSEPMLP